MHNYRSRYWWNRLRINRLFRWFHMDISRRLLIENEFSYLNIDWFRFRRSILSYLSSTYLNNWLVRWMNPIPFFSIFLYKICEIIHNEWFIFMTISHALFFLRTYFVFKLINKLMIFLCELFFPLLRRCAMKCDCQRLMSCFSRSLSLAYCSILFSDQNKING